MKKNNQKSTGHALWDRMASHYDKRFEKWYNPIFPILETSMVPNLNVLEIGSGSGLISFKVIPYASKFVGVDISPEMVQITNAKLKKYEDSLNYSDTELPATNQLKQEINFIPGDGLEFLEQEIHLESSNERKFDRILLFNVLHVVDDPIHLLEKISSLIEPGCRFILCDFCHGEKMSTKYWGLSKLMGLASKLGLMGKLNRFTFDSITSIVEKVGLEIVERHTFPKGFPLIYLVIEKVED